MAETKIPPIHSVPANLDPALKRLLESLKEALEVRLGRTGDSLDQAITFRDLLDSGIAIGSLQVGQTIASPTPTPTPTNNDPPTGLVASCAFTKIMLTWDDHGLGSTFAYAEIKRSDGELFDNAIPLATTVAAVYTDAVDYNQTWYYWVRFVSNAVPPVPGDWVGPASCTTAENIEEVMDTLSEELSDLPGYSTLTTAIDVDVAAAQAAAIAGSAYIIRATSAPTVRDTSPTTPLQPFDVWFDTDDNNQAYIRNTANNAWVEARDGTLVTLVDAHASTLTGHTSSIATANTNIATVTAANSALSTTVTTLSATVDTKAQTFAQDAAPADNTANALLDGDLWIDTNDSNKLYRWDGDSWEQMIDPSTSGISVYAQAAEPSGGTYIAGDLWFDTDDGNKQYRYNGSAWVAIDDTRISSTSTALTNLTATVTGTGGHASQLTSLNSTILVKTQTFAQPGIPTSLTIGDLWVDTDDSNKIYRAASIGADQITGGEWVLLRDSGISTALTNASTAIANAATAQGTADGKVTTFFQAGIPGTDVKEGDLWIDSDDNKLYRAAADDADQIAVGEWVEIQDDAIATAITNAATAQSTADGKIVSFFQAGIPGTNVKSGDLWIDTDDGNKLYRAAADGADQIAAGEWVEVTADSLTTFSQPGVPTSITVGDIWIDTDDNNAMYRANAVNVSAIVTSGNGWYLLTDDRIATNATAVENLSTAVDLDGVGVLAHSNKIVALESTVNDGTTGVAATAGALSTLTTTVSTRARTFADNTEPADPYDPSGEDYDIVVGDLWIDTNDDNKMYRWNGTIWYGLPPTKVKTFVEVDNLSTSPISINIGDLWFNTSDNHKLYRAEIAGANAIASGKWIAVADARITSNATKVDALEASVGKVYGARIITANTDNTVTVETMVNTAGTTSTAVHGITGGQVTTGVFLTLQGFGNYNGVEAEQLNKTFKVATLVNTTRLTVEIVGDPATGSGTGTTLANGVTIGTSAGFTQLATVTADMQGNAQSAYVLQVNANGEVGGMVIEANSSASGDDSGVAIQFSADKFAIWNGPDSGTPRTFDGSDAGVVILNDDTITLSSADYNSLYNTTAVTYSHGGGSAIGGLVNDTVYYVIKVASTTKIKLATTETLASAGTGRVLSAVGSGTSHTVNNVSTAPFIVSNGNVYIDAVRIQDAQIVGAKIADATIETAHIIDLNADKIRTGTLDVSAVIKIGSSGSGATDQRIEISAASNRIVVVDGSS